MKAYDEDAKYIYIFFINKSITILGCSTVNSLTIGFLGHISQQFRATRSLLQRVVASGGRSGPCGVCYREWSGVHCRDLPESGVATWNLLQRVEWGSGHYRDLPESLGRMVEARLGRLMERTGSLSQQSKRGLDVSEVTTSLLLSGALGADAAGGSHLL